MATSSYRKVKDYELAGSAPDFFIVGAARCGTTAMHSWLKDHPSIWMTDPDKEPGYYCDFWGTETFADYSLNFTGATNGQLRGDASTHYLTSPNTPKILHEMNPNARIIVSLRNPADRAFSLFSFMQSQGYENLKSFDEALRVEQDRATRFLKPNSEAFTYPYNFLYFQSGCYHEQLKRYFDVFPRDQVLVIVFEEMIKQPFLTHAKVMEHLGLPVEKPKETLPRENGSWNPRSLRFQSFLKKQVIPACKALHIPHHQVYRFLSKKNQDSSSKSRISPAIREQLMKAYRSDIEATEKLLGRSLDIWS